MGLIKTDRKARLVAMLMIVIPIGMVLSTLFFKLHDIMFASILAIPIIIAAIFLLLGFKSAIIWLRVLTLPLCLPGMLLLVLMLIWCGSMVIKCHHMPSRDALALLLLGVATSAFTFPFVLSLKWKLAQSLSDGKQVLHCFLAFAAMFILYTPVNGLVCFYWMYKSSYYSVAEIPGRNELLLESRGSTLDSDVKISILCKSHLVLTRQTLFNEFTESGWTGLEYHYSNDGQLIIFSSDLWNAPNSPLCVYDAENGGFYSISNETLDKEGTFVKLYADCVTTRETLQDMIIKHGGMGKKVTFHHPDPVKFALQNFFKLNLFVLSR